MSKNNILQMQIFYKPQLFKVRHISHSTADCFFPSLILTGIRLPFHELSIKQKAEKFIVRRNASTPAEACSLSFPLQIEQSQAFLRES